MKFGFSLSLLAAVSLGGALAPRPAHGALIIDVRAVSITGTGSITNNKSVIADVGASIAYQVWATITGTTGTNDGLQSANGRVVSSTGGLLGNLTHTNNATFATGAFLNGTAQDVDGDGDTDVGATTNNNTFLGRIAYLAATSQAGSSHLLGSGNFVVSPQTLTNGLSTSLNFQIAAIQGLNANPLWTENGVGRTQTSGTVGSGVPLVISAVAPIPEPGTMALGGVLLAGLAGWKLRRKKA